MSATRVCTKCLTEKPIDDFPWKSRVLNRRHAVCKLCTASRSNGWYKNNKSSHIQNVMAHKKIDRQEARQFVWDYLTEHPCAICGEADPVVLEFDHINALPQNSLFDCPENRWNIAISGLNWCMEAFQPISGDKRQSVP